MSVLYRVRLSKDPEYYDAQDPTAFYWTENALQYHYAELVANGIPIPAFDPKLQAPEGVKIFENLTILMEYPCGWLYRFLHLKEKNVLFHTWTIIFIAGCASLGLFAIFTLCRSLGISSFYSIVAGLLLNFSLVAVGRSTFGFLNEDFALPFIFFGLSAYFHALKNDKGRVIFALIAGICFLISLAGWHFSRFIFSTIVVCAVLDLWIFEKNPESRINAGISLFYLLSITFVGIFFIPVLRSRLYFISIPFALGFGTVLGLHLFKQQCEKPLIYSLRGWYCIIIGLIFLIASIIISRILNTEAEYAHVWSLIINKIKFLGIKPAQPEMLDYSARSLWIEAFNSPHPVSLFKNLFPIIIPAVFGFVYLLKNGKTDNIKRVFLLLSLIFFFSYLMIERMGVVNNYFVVALSVSLSTTVLRKSTRVIRFLIPAGLVLIFLFNFYHGYNLHNTTDYLKILRKVFGSETSDNIYNWRLNNVELVRYIRFRTPENAIFLSSFGVGPLILTYANRPIALQPKFEVKHCQNRVKEFFGAIYDSEENFYELCKNWQANYFVYDIKITLDNSRDGGRWIAGRMQIQTNSAAFLLHFSPEKLRHFELIYQNNYYRLFKVLEKNENPQIYNFQYQPVYDISAYGNQTNMALIFDDRYTINVIDKIRQAKLLLQIANKMLTNHPEQARQQMERSISLYPSLIGSATTLGIANALTGRIEQGLSLCQKEIEINPLFPLGHYNLAYCLYLIGDIPGALEELRLTLKLDPNFKSASEMIRQLQK
ncbi:MAG: hypothetical protein ABIL20_04020 [candidate division WOR-3 bacterium]